MNWKIQNSDESSAPHYESFSLVRSFVEKTINTEEGLIWLFIMTKIDSYSENKLWMLLSLITTIDSYSENQLWMLLFSYDHDRFVLGKQTVDATFSSS